MARTANPSLQKFQKLLKSIPKPIRQASRKELAVEARKMVRAMKSAAPREEGDLNRSIRMSTSQKLRVIIRAGGPLTRTPSGYDYSIAVEFGAQKAQPKPFFWPSYRARKDSVRASQHRVMRQMLKQTWNV